MNKNLLIIIVLALAVGVGTAVFLNQRAADEQAGQEQSAPEPNGAAAPALGDIDNGDQQEAPTVETDHTIVYTDDGFSPLEITIQAGETVAFENNSSSPMWIASDPHPSHTDLPEFDAERGYEPGETYSFTFEDAGTWGYHDHLRSFNTAVVIVE